MSARAKAEQAAEILGLALTDLTADAVTVAYRRLARSTHPDAGGTAEAFARVDWAKHVLHDWVATRQPASAPTQQKRPCERCGGSGNVTLPSKRPGSAGLRQTCPLCRGTGDADNDVT